MFGVWMIGVKLLQAAKEFESELKKEPDSETDPPGEKPTAISEERKDEGKISSSKESVWESKLILFS